MQSAGHPCSRPFSVRSVAVVAAVSLTAAAVVPALVAAPSASAAEPGLVINEVQIEDDWVEMTNTSDQAIDASGYVISDDKDDHEFLVPEGTKIEPGDFVAFDVKDEFGLGKDDEVRVFDGDGGTLVDEYSWGEDVATSYGRWPDGTGEFAPTSVASKGAPNSGGDPEGTVRINEIESNGDPSGDWIELTNTGSEAVNVSGWVLRDDKSDEGDDKVVIPEGTTIEPDAFVSFETGEMGLGDPDQARLFSSESVERDALVDSFSWSSHSKTTLVRCPDGTGTFADTAEATRDAANDCAEQEQPVDERDAWPGSQDVATADAEATFDGDLSGLVYQGDGAKSGVIWAVNNGTGQLYRLEQVDGEWTPTAGDGWAATTTLHYGDGSGTPDAEGVALAGDDPADGIYVSTERDNDEDGVSRPAVLKYVPDTSAESLNAEEDWNLAKDLPGIGANGGLEGVTYVPDSVLVAGGFRDDSGDRYDPSDLPEHGDGLFLVGVEGDGNTDGDATPSEGRVYAYALNDDGSFKRIATVSGEDTGAMDLLFDTETNLLFDTCDELCGTTLRTFALNPKSGKFELQHTYAPPEQMSDEIANEGFALAPRAQCSDGTRPVFWADDGDTDGHSLRAGTIDCSVTGPKYEQGGTKPPAEDNPKDERPAGAEDGNAADDGDAADEQAADGAGESGTLANTGLDRAGLMAAVAGALALVAGAALTAAARLRRRRG